MSLDGNSQTPTERSRESNSNSSFLNQLSPELRNRIYSEVLIERKTLKIDTVHKTPALLQTNQQIRHEASSIYYLDDSFRIICRRFDCVNYTRLLKIGAKAQLEKMWKAKTIASDWLEEHYYDRIPGLIPSNDRSSGTNAVARAFTMMNTMKKNASWMEVKIMLEIYREAIAHTSDTWGEYDPEDRANHCSAAQKFGLKGLENILEYTIIHPSAGGSRP